MLRLSDLKDNYCMFLVIMGHIGCFDVLTPFGTSVDIAQLEYSHLKVCTCIIHCMDSREKNYTISGIMDG